MGGGKGKGKHTTKRERGVRGGDKVEDKVEDRVEVVPGVTVESFRRFRAALIGPIQGLPKRRRLRR